HQNQDNTSNPDSWWNPEGQEETSNQPQGRGDTWVTPLVRWQVVGRQVSDGVIEENSKSAKPPRETDISNQHQNCNQNPNNYHRNLWCAPRLTYSRYRDGHIMASPHRQHYA